MTYNNSSIRITFIIIKSIPLKTQCKQYPKIKANVNTIFQNRYFK